jgi:hypothetical protein
VSPDFAEQTGAGKDPTRIENSNVTLARRGGRPVVGTDADGNTTRRMPRDASGNVRPNVTEFDHTAIREQIRGKVGHGQLKAQTANTIVAGKQLQAGGVLRVTVQHGEVDGTTLEHIITNELATVLATATEVQAIEVDAVDASNPRGGRFVFTYTRQPNGTYVGTVRPSFAKMEALPDEAPGGAPPSAPPAPPAAAHADAPAAPGSQHVDAAAPPIVAPSAPAPPLLLKPVLLPPKTFHMEELVPEAAAPQQPRRIAAVSEPPKLRVAVDDVHAPVEAEQRPRLRVDVPPVPTRIAVDPSVDEVAQQQHDEDHQHAAENQAGPRRFEARANSPGPSGGAVHNEPVVNRTRVARPSAPPIPARPAAPPAAESVFEAKPLSPPVAANAASPPPPKAAPASAPKPGALDARVGTPKGAPRITRVSNPLASSQARADQVGGAVVGAIMIVDIITKAIGGKIQADAEKAAMDRIAGEVEAFQNEHPDQAVKIYVRYRITEALPDSGLSGTREFVGGDWEAVKHPNQPPPAIAVAASKDQSIQTGSTFVKPRETPKVVPRYMADEAADKLRDRLAHAEKKLKDFQPGLGESIAKSVLRRGEIDLAWATRVVAEVRAKYNEAEALRKAKKYTEAFPIYEAAQEQLQPVAKEIFLYSGAGEPGPLDRWLSNAQSPGSATSGLPKPPPPTAAQIAARQKADRENALRLQIGNDAAGVKPQPPAREEPQKPRPPALPGFQAKTDEPSDVPLAGYATPVDQKERAAVQGLFEYAKQLWREGWESDQAMGKGKPPPYGDFPARYRVWRGQVELARSKYSTQAGRLGELLNNVDGKLAEYAQHVTERTHQ